MKIIRQAFSMLKQNRMSNLPFELEKGIVFEDSGNIIKWGENLNLIKNIDRPEVNDKGTVIKWKDKQCFGGQKVNVSIIMDDYHNLNGKLHENKLQKKYMLSLTNDNKIQWV